MAKKLARDKDDKRRLEERSIQEVKKIAKDYGLKLAPKMAKDKVIHAIRVEETKRYLEAEEEARLKLKAQKLAEYGYQPGDPGKPPFEYIAIEGGMFMGKKYPPSKKILVTFSNRYNPPTEDEPAGILRFRKGEKYKFTFFEQVNGQTALFVIPECLISLDPAFKDMSLVQKCRTPIYRKVKDEKTGMAVDKKVGSRPDYEFHRVGDAPEDAPFGFFDTLKDGTFAEPD